MGCFASQPTVDRSFEEMCQHAKQKLTPVSILNTNKSFFFKDEDGFLWKLRKHIHRKEILGLYNNYNTIRWLPNTECILKPLQVHMVDRRAIALKMEQGETDLFDFAHSSFDQKIIFQAFHDISEAIHWLHDHGMAHRDIKPENVVFHEGRFKLIDFDFCSPLHQFELCGTEGYMCCHKMTAEWPGSSSDSSRRADVYAFGKMVIMIMCNGAYSGHLNRPLYLWKMFCEQLPMARPLNLGPIWQPWLDLAIACCDKVPPTSIPPLPTTMEDTIRTIDGETCGTTMQVVDADPMFA